MTSCIPAKTCIVSINGAITVTIYTLAQMCTCHSTPTQRTYTLACLLCAAYILEMTRCMLHAVGLQCQLETAGA